jgi:hypothetical protein
MSLIACLVMGLFALSLPRAWAEVTLVEQGEPRAALVVPAEPAADEQQAAKELQAFFAAMSGATLAMSPAAPAGAVPILIGRAAPPELEKLIRARGDDPGAFVLQVTDRQVALRGLTPEGTLFAAYELLEQLGMRWFMPGELGTVTPHLPTLRLAAQTTVQVPSFPGRWHNGHVFDDRHWGRRQRMGGPFFPSAHGIDLGREITFEKFPQYWALINGQRVKTQLCISNPEVVRLATQRLKEFFRANPEAPWKGLGPNDGSGFCECESCRALDGGDWDPFSSEPSVTDRYVWFFNQLLRGLEDEFPDKKIAFYAYHSYMRPPVKVRPDKRIVPALAVIALCRIHGPHNPVCPEKSYWVWLAREWGKILPEVYDRGYWFNLADPGFPFSMAHRLRVEIPLGHELGLQGWRVETLNHWASETPSLYLAGKLMWNHEGDVEALLDDFAEKFFGPAARPLRQYLTLLDRALEHGDYHTGSSWDLPHLYPEALRREAERLLNQAARLAPAGPYAQRVRLFRQSFNYLQAFVQMLACRDRYDFAGAHGQLRQLQSLQQTLLAYQPPMLNPRGAPAYLKRFFAPAVEQGYARTTGGNRLVAGFADEWEFQLDPQRLGADIGLFRPELTGGNWQPLRTFSRSWSTQGLRTYKGQCWYRQTVQVPSAEAGKRLFLWFGGVDEKARVWVNGREIGISPGSAFTPFELDATSAIRPGANVVVVCVLNQHVNELGTGGIVAPVMLYAPRLGAAARLENVIELSPTFP